MSCDWNVGGRHPGLGRAELREPPQLSETSGAGLCVAPPPDASETFGARLV